MATLNTNKLSTLSKRIILGSCLFFIALDVYWAVNTPHGDTISEVTLAFSHRYLFIPFIFGVVTGHLFWPYRKPIRWRMQRLGILWLLGILVCVIDYFHWMQVTPILPAIVSIPLGHLLWPQTTYDPHELELPAR